MRNMYAHPTYAPPGIMKVIPFWEYRYPRTFIGMGATGAALCVIAGAILMAVGYYPWGVALFAAAALRSWIAYQLVQFVHS
ncbi:MAG: hypothetical protein ACRDOU_00070 [Streptosporangiaceae bacterium]